MTCECVCGQETRVSHVTDRSHGWVRGVPRRFKQGHGARTHGPGLPPGVVSLYDPEDHDLIMRYAWGVEKGYLCVTVEGQKSYFHRMIMNPGCNEVDHKNGNRLDNRRSNLRVVTLQENRQNRTTVRGVSGFRGVSKNKNRWAASANVNKIRYHLGTFDTPEEAAAVASEWRLKNMPGALS